MNSHSICLNHVKVENTASTSEVSFNQNELAVLDERRYSLSHVKFENTTSTSKPRFNQNELAVLGEGRYNLNHIKFGDTPYTFKASCTQDELVVLGERRYNLNESNEKFLSVGLDYYSCYWPCIKLFGAQHRGIIFNEYEWNKFLTFQEVITCSLHYNMKAEALDAGNFLILFELCCDKRGIKILKDDSYIYLEYEAVCKLWELLPLVGDTINVLRSQQFANYFKILKQGLKNIKIGSVFDNALNILKSQDHPSSVNVNMALELLYVHPEIFENECTPIYCEENEYY